MVLTTRHEQAASNRVVMRPDAEWVFREDAGEPMARDPLQAVRLSGEHSACEARPVPMEHPNILRPKTHGSILTPRPHPDQVENIGVVREDCGQGAAVTGVWVTAFLPMVLARAFGRVPTGCYTLRAWTLAPSRQLSQSARQRSASSLR